MLKEKSFRVLISILLCGLALHYMIITIILKDNFLIKFWKEFLIIILFLDTILYQIIKREKNALISRIELMFFLFIIALTFGTTIMTKEINAIVYIVRLYLLPMLVYYIARINPKFTKKNVYKIIKTLTIFYIILSVWGIFQAVFLGDDFLINLGYPLKYEGRLRDSYYFGGFGDMQRVMATFANTNVFAAIIGILLLVNLFNEQILNLGKKYKIVIWILSVAFLLSFSRANWIAFIFIFMILNWRKKKVWKGVIIACIVIIFLSIIYIQITNINLLNILAEYISNTITMQDTSAAGRSKIWSEAFNIFKNNIWGIGVGQVGEVSTKIFGELRIPAESSYFAILLDTGIQGGISYVLAMIFMYINTFRYIGNSIEVRSYVKSIRYILIYLAIIFIASNHIYDLEIMITTLFLVGISRNKSFIESVEDEVRL